MKERRTHETYHLGLTLVHGFRVTEHPLYETWGGIKSRCTNSDHEAYENYGGRGITYCERWKHFKNFAEDMYSTYKPGLTIERINNDGDYEPLNCRWATRKEQRANAREPKLGKNNTSGVKGISFRKDRRKFRADPFINGVRTYLGSFDTLEEAIKAIENCKH